MKLTNVIEVNKERVLLNTIKFNIWENKDIESDLLNRINKYSDYVNLGVEQDIDIKEIKVYFKEYTNKLQNKKAFNLFIKRIKEQNNNIKGFNNLMECEGLEEFKSAKELHTFILNNVIPAVNKI